MASSRGGATMQQSDSQATPSIISFGDFRLYPAQRLLLRDGEPIKLGARSLDILLALAERPGEVVSQKDLISRVWRGLFVEEVSLRVSMAGLRKALDDGRGGVRYLATVPGQGYSLSAQDLAVLVDPAPPPAPAPEHRAAYTLPPAPKRVVGRAEVIEDLVAKLENQRFVSLVGPGGIGKTTVVLSLAHDTLQAFEGAVCFVELSPVAQPDRLAATVAAAFHRPVLADDPLPELVQFLRGKRALLILDGCEHLIDGVAGLSRRLVDETEGVHVLATSREALGAQGEHVLRLTPLGTPPEGDDRSAEEARAYPAVQLFFSRLEAAGMDAGPSDEEVKTVCQICRRLDGIALAIELVAARAAVFGIRDTALLLESELALTWPGRRTAPERHQTLNATLNWSYNLLSEAERALLDRLSIFSGAFTLDAAQAIGSDDVGSEPFFGALAGLLAKSLVSVGPVGSEPRYRLLDTTRTFARGKLQAAGERDRMRRQHALYYRELLRATAADGVAPGKPQATATDLDEVRAALAWAFGEGASPMLGADLAADSAPIWLGSALLAEGRGWMAKAAEACIDSAEPSSLQQLRIQHSFASTELFSTGFTEATIAAWKMTLERAVALGDLPVQLRSYLVLWGGEIRGALYADALRTSERCAESAKDAPDPGDRAQAQWMLGHSKHHLGRFDEARTHLDRYLALETEASRIASTRQTGIDRWANVQGVLSSVLWILGLPDQAKRRGEQAAIDGRAFGFAIAAGLGMTWAVLNTYLMETDVDAAESEMVELLEHGRTHAIDSDAGWALCLMGLCQARRGQFDSAAAMVSEGLRLLESAQMTVFNSLVRAHICEFAVKAGRLADAQAWMDELRSKEGDQEHWCSSEVLRVRGLIAQADGAAAVAESLISEALRLARRQGALSWELRASVSLGELWRSEGRGGQALGSLESLYERFSEGRKTADLMAAGRMIDELRGELLGASMSDPR